MDLIFPLLILFMIGLVFMSSRQRKKQESQAKSLQNSLAVGDVVVMTSGISGTVVDTDDERTIDLEIAPDVITTWLRAAVREKLVDDVESEHSEHESLGTGPATEHVAGESEVATSSTPVVTADEATDEPQDARTTGTTGTTAPRTS